MTTAGLLIFILGLIQLVIGRLTLPILARGYRARHPDKDPSKHDRFQRIYARSFASLTLLVGATLFVVGLLNGGSVRFGT